ncbi:MAG: aminotransferase class III-fold pyridoxal phosphate-dependent enzyme [Candidatus Microthrix parvicella]
MASAVAVDARAATRGDILPSTANGTTVYPRFMTRAEGPFVWDVDGNRFTDFLLGYGPVVLGHAQPDVMAAAVAQLSTGNCIAPLWSPRQVELAHLLTETLPGAESALLLKTGSDATSAAIRLARAFTGRDLVLRCGYHGWHDWAVEQPGGVVSAVRAHTVPFPYGELAALEALLVEHGDRTACVMMMPFELEPVPDGYLAAVRALTSDHGALFVLDEVRSGFRLALGGAQQHFGVTADLTAWSKAMGNGFAISAVTGREDVMHALRMTKISSTFFANPVDMAASLTTIRMLRDTDAIERLWRRGSAMMTGLDELSRSYGIPTTLLGYPPMPFMRFDIPDPALRSRVESTFYRATTEGGLLLHPEHQWFLSAAHAASDIDRALDVCDAAFAGSRSIYEDPSR